jgi:hypothetical protein
MRTFTHASLGPALLLVLAGCPKGHPADDSTGAAVTGIDASSSTGAVTPTSGDPDTGAASSTSTTTGAPTGSTGVDASSSSTGALQTTGDPGTSTGTSTGDSSTSTSSSGDATTGPPPRLFDCFGCNCDADMTFCRKVFAGVVAVEDPPLCPIVDARSLESGCVVYPADCAEPPSCDCLPLMNNNCFCNESERVPGAFEVTCPLP